MMMTRSGAAKNFQPMEFDGQTFLFFLSSSASASTFWGFVWEATVRWGADQGLFLLLLPLSKEFVRPLLVTGTINHPSHPPRKRNYIPGGEWAHPRAPSICFIQRLRL